MTRARDRQAGFTLMELMVVVALVAILAAVALPSFAGESRKAAGTAEVSAFFGELRIREEQYHTENGAYLATGATESATFPATPTAAATAVGALPASWTALKVRTPESKVRCGYVVIAGTATTGTVGTIAATSFGYTHPNQDWFYVLAHCNLDNDPTVDGYYFISSDSATIQKLNPGK